MGKVSQSINEVYQLYLINMKDELLVPLHHFNHNIIRKCQEKKVTLKTKKGQYDMQQRNMEQLQEARAAFTSTVQEMEKDTFGLLASLKQYMSSYAAYAKIHEQSLSIEDKMYWAPPNINNTMHLDSDTEDMNDNTETMSSFGDWGKASIVVKQGWMKKRGRYTGFKKRWFKLFTNRKLVYLTQNG
eukprot:407969_1